MCADVVGQIPPPHLRAQFVQALRVMHEAFQRLEEKVPVPQRVALKGHFAFRHVEKTIEQALIEKLARVVSGLHAIDVLLLNGFVQEQGVLCRTLDEIDEDIWFLAGAIIKNEMTKRHRQYLEAFFAEEFVDPEDAIGSSQERNYPPRRKIRAYIHRTFGEGVEQTRTLRAGEVLHRAYSGFVHAASPHIMDMCGGDPPHFHLIGMKGTPRINDHAEDAKNYFFRGLSDMHLAAIALRATEVAAGVDRYLTEFESRVMRDND